MTDSSTEAEGAARLCPLLHVEGCLTSSRLSGLIHGNSWRGAGRATVEGGQEHFSFQADEKEQDVVAPASLKRGNKKAFLFQLIFKKF